MFSFMSFIYVADVLYCNIINVFYLVLYVVLHGLLPIMDELLPDVKQRFCVRNLYDYFRKKYPGKLLIKIIWKEVKSTYIQAWEREIKGMRVVNEKDFKHMMKN